MATGAAATESSARTGRLTVFQRLARTWDEVHPYNAGHACRVRGTFAVGDVERAWNDTLNALGLGRVRACRREFSFRDSPQQPVTLLAGDVDLSRLFTTELNRAFDADAGEPPFRPFAQQLGETTWLGLTYQHWVADSFSARVLFSEWIARVIDPEAPPPRAVKLAAVEHSLLRHWPMPQAMLALVRRHAEFRRTRKPLTLGSLNYPVRVRVLDALRGVIPGLLRYARSRRVKVNDVLLAALTEACDRLVPTQHRAQRRALALSSIMDLRPSLPRGSDRSAFGCLLGFSSVVCNPGEVRDWNRLLRCVAAQKPARRPGESEGPPGVLWMLAAEIGTWFTPLHRIYGFYRKEAPFAAGISNVNLSGSWFDEHHPAEVIDYVRVAPTGPMVPLALSVTTLGDDLHLSMTYRSALFNDWTAQELAQAFATRLTRVASENA